MDATYSAIYQTAQIKQIENLAEQQLAISSEQLMQRAGQAACDFLLKRWPNNKNLTIFCGAGNNGGDGYVLGLLAQQKGCQVTIWQVGDAPKKPAARAALQACIQAKMTINSFTEETSLDKTDLIVDAICGIGIQKKLRDIAVHAVKKMQSLNVPIFAIDVPTGVNIDTGTHDGVAVYATVTMTFLGNKLGLLTGEGAGCAGEVVVNDLQLPADLFSQVDPVAITLTPAFCHPYLAPRSRNWHKGLCGHVLIIGGERGYSGAPRMAAVAALKVGAGLVTVATHPDNVATMNACFPEIMCHGLNRTADLLPLLKKADVVVLGVGLGLSSWSKNFWQLAEKVNLPQVIDGDGLTLLASLPRAKQNWVLTPHPGEAGRLLQMSSEQVQENRLTAAEMLQKKYDGVAVLKGAGSIIIAPSSLPVICDKGNPGMATAGMGDVLSGVIGGLIAQGIPLAMAANLGVYLHAFAGDLAAQEGERGMVATDLFPYLRKLVNRWGRLSDSHH